jgi:hypothetical protein
MVPWAQAERLRPSANSAAKSATVTAPPRLVKRRQVSTADDVSIGIDRPTKSWCTGDTTTTVDIGTSNAASTGALNFARPHVVAADYTVGSYANAAPGGIVARIRAASTALGPAGSRVVALKVTAIATQLAAVVRVMAICHALVFTDGSTGIRRVGTLEVTGVRLALEKTRGPVAASTILVPLATGSYVVMTARCRKRT